MAEKMDAERANAMMGEGYHCSQCVWLHYAETHGMDPKEALRHAAALGGGCFRGGTCGTITAAMLIIGENYGFDKPTEEADALMKDKAHEVQNRFIKEYGSTDCTTLLDGYDCLLPEAERTCGREDPWEYCGNYVETVCNILDEMLARDGKE